MPASRHGAETKLKLSLYSSYTIWYNVIMVQYPWQLYEKPVYWTVPNDGAALQCADCKCWDDHTEFFFTQVPSGARRMIHKDCIDEDWLASATFLGEFPVK